jgi:hypothetical protein
MKKIILQITLLCLSIFSVEAQQTLKGKVLDKNSKLPIIGASIIITSTDPQIGTTSDSDGYYSIPNVPVGRQSMTVSYLGYQKVSLLNILITAGKEVELDIEMQDEIKTINNVIITSSNSSKHITNNEMATVSSRSFTMEEVNRYSGGRSDPSRLVANFAGVSTPDDSRNDIVIRGNSPLGVLWRIEGLPIPNPNHFATVGTTGGPVSALNTNLLRSSDFFTSAFPAEYGNANAGVFDIGLRNGNSNKAENTFQMGALTGLELMTEGPISKKNQSSYLIGYRYSFTGLAQQIGLNIGTSATPKYQDLSFKINFGKSKIGRFTLFGLGGSSTIDFLHDEIDTTDLFADPTRDSYFQSKIGIVGLNHFIQLNKKSYLKTTLGISYIGAFFNQDTLNNEGSNPNLITENNDEQIRTTLSVLYNNKINSKLTIKSGIIAENYSLNYFYRDREFTPNWNYYWDINDNTQLLQAYIQTKYRISDAFTLLAGIHTQLLTLNNSFAAEPRASIVYTLNEKNTLTLGYGMHSQMQTLNIYFNQSTDSSGIIIQTNKDLGFSRNQHLAIAYDFYPAKDWRVKVEAYYQFLNKIPVSSFENSYSVINEGSSFQPNESVNLVNEGSGSNVGAEFTLEKFFSKGFYGLITGSIYDSKYKGSDGIEHNTAFNGRYVANVLAGKEFLFGKEKAKAFTINIKATRAGGRYYTPVDLAASQIAGQEIKKGDEFAFSVQQPDYFRFDLKLGVRLNNTKHKFSQSFYFDMQNLTNNKNVFALRYNPVSNQINTAYQIGFFPDFVYKIEF